VRRDGNVGRYVSGAVGFAGWAACSAAVVCLGGMFDLALGGADADVAAGEASGVGGADGVVGGVGVGVGAQRGSACRSELPPRPGPKTNYRARVAISPAGWQSRAPRHANTPN
jgi:hypothetical protein